MLAPPYDVVSPAEQEELHAQDPHNVVRLELARGGTDEPLAGRYAQAAETLRDWRRHNVLGHDPRPAFYPYEERFATPQGDRTRRGFFATVRLHPWSDFVVLPHERTRPKPKADRRELLHTCRTQFSPIFCLFEDDGGEVREILDEVTRQTPVACGTVTSPAGREIARDHTLWWAANKPAQRLVDLFVNRRLYIADGHHRYETALDYRDERRADARRWDTSSPYEYVMALLVPADDPGLVVLPTHRLIQAPEPLDASALLEKLGQQFTVESWPLPEREPGQALADELRRRGAYGHVFAALGLEPGVAHLLSLRGAPRDWHAPASWRTLDVGLLEALIVEPFERDHPGAEVEFTRDADECIRFANAASTNLAVMLNATTVGQILAVARAGDKMPEKSTYFMPKVATGMVMYPLE